MPLSEQALKEAFQSLNRSELPGCPSAETLSQLAAGELPDARRMELVTHVADCSTCAVELKVLMQTKSWTDEASERLRDAQTSSDGGQSIVAAGVADDLVAPREGEREELEPEGRVIAAPARFGARFAEVSRQSWVAALAAALLLVLAVAVISSRMGEPDEPSDRLRSANPMADGVTPPSDARLDAPPSQLDWPPQVGATGYSVTLYDAGAESLWTSQPTLDDMIVLDQDVLTQLQPGASYFWTVSAEGAVRQSELGPFWFHITE